VRLAKTMNRFPREVEELSIDEFWELVAEFSLESDEWEAEHPRQ